MLLSRYTDRIEGTGFINPDGSKVAVLLNRSGETQAFHVLRA